MAPVGTKCMVCVTIPMQPGKAPAALELFQTHEMGIKYTLASKGALKFDLGVCGDDLVIFEFWASSEDFTAYFATRGDAEKMKDWNPSFMPLVAGAPAFKIMEYGYSAEPSTFGCF
ncbi:hypothetical protein M885DRAFT_514728 [Pelagophyceae sp. CCMP2097]|nr:hypothetical protein M885DRAFT_514728 [Pelagophyceae sp. CCMP2097]